MQNWRSYTRRPARRTSGPQRRTTMKDESRIAANTKLVREFVGRVFNKQDASAVPEFMAADVEWHGGTFGTVKGSNGMTAMFGGFFAALPDLHATELAIVATDDTVWVR